MFIRVFDRDADYSMVFEWWKKHEGWDPIPLHALSRFGMVVEKNDVPLCAAWLYLTTSSISWIEWLVTNPDAPLRDRANGIELLLSRLVLEATQFGAQSIFSSIKSKGLIRLYERVGFSVTDTGMTNAIYKIEATCQSQHPQHSQSRAESPQSGQSPGA